MALREHMEIGERIEIVKKYEILKDITGYSMVQDIPHDDAIVASIPMYAGYPILLNPGDKVNVFFFRDYCCYSFPGEVAERYKIKEVPVVNINKVGPIDRIQRRKFYRLRIVLPMTFTLVKESTMSRDDLVKNEPPAHKGYCMDISGSGLRLITDYRLETNSIIYCHIPLLDEGDIDIKGRIVRSGTLDGSTLKYEYGVAFMDMNPRTQDRLVEFIFREQRDLIRKGME